MPYIVNFGYFQIHIHSIEVSVQYTERACILITSHLLFKYALSVYLEIKRNSKVIRRKRYNICFGRVYLTLLHI